MWVPPRVQQPRRVPPSVLLRVAAGRVGVARPRASAQEQAKAPRLRGDAAGASQLPKGEAGPAGSPRLQGNASGLQPVWAELRPAGTEPRPVLRLADSRQQPWEVHN